MRPPVIVFCHVAPAAAEPMFRAAPEGSRAVYFNPGGLGSDYGAAAVRTPLLDAIDVGLSGNPIVLVGWSAGVYAIRQWLKDAQTREQVAAVVLLDGLHGALTADGQCSLRGSEGVVRYGKLARQKPSDHLLVVTHSSIEPGEYASTASCARALTSAVGGTGTSFVVLGYEGSDAAAHVRQLRQVGPMVFEDYVTPHLEGKRSPWPAIGLGVGLGAMLAFALRFMR